MMSNPTLPVDTDMIRTVITTAGVLHGPLPECTAPTILVDLRTALRNPADDPGMIKLTGLDAKVRDHVLNTPGAQQIIDDTVGRILAAYTWTGATGHRQDALIICMGGRHRSVAIAEEIARRLHAHGHGADVEHRDIGKPVQPSSKNTEDGPV